MVLRLRVMNNFLLGWCTAGDFLVSDILRFVKYGLYAFFAIVPCLRKKGVRENGKWFSILFQGERGALGRVYDC